MQRRRLGEIEVSAIGLGCATMTPFYDEPNTQTAVETLQRAREIGVDFLDTSDAYGQGKNEELIAGAIRGHRDDYVIATGKTHSVRDFLRIAFEVAGLGSYEPYVVIDPRFVRPAEVDRLIGDASKAQNKLGWEPEVGFERLVAMMVESDIKRCEHS